MNTRSCGQSSWMTKALLPLTDPSCSPDLNPVEHLWGCYVSVRYGHRLSRSSLVSWSRCGRRHHLQSHQEEVQTVSSAFRLTAESHHELLHEFIRRWFKFFTPTVGVNPALSEVDDFGFCWSSFASFCSQQIIESTSVKILNLNHSFIETWRGFNMFPECVVHIWTDNDNNNDNMNIFFIFSFMQHFSQQSHKVLCMFEPSGLKRGNNRIIQKQKRITAEI